MEKDCCEKKEEQKAKSGIFAGIFYGLFPHTFCILFIVFTILGITAFSAILKPFLLNQYFFYILIFLSFVLTTVSAAIYLKKIGKLSFFGIRKKWKYLLILYGVAIAVNLALFVFVFPAVANINSKKVFSPADVNINQIRNGDQQRKLVLKVEIPCSGHALLITEYLKKIDGVENVRFKSPNLFDVIYDNAKTNVDQILDLSVFDEYKATIITE